ncbi:single stranded DNA-binding domain-containing protein [Frankia nepalensis]|uniref:Uncharacterized protein n=1 Tax=Frankia nepalensis TaxID=1836974 RepID=A0A937RN38_9ACTN|nr:hypothetical protein [Frankia nepalensis]MBL7628901.1 hypothetical protein [Frankia nepalensis]
MAELVFVDEHALLVAARPGETWQALADTLDRSFTGSVVEKYARVVGCVDPGPSGPRPLTEGSTIIGFRVVTAKPGAELGLAGRHRFSDYTLTFRLEEPAPGVTRIRAVTKADFPGRLGRYYRAAVIGSHGHAVLLRRLLGAARHRAERHAAAIPDPATSQLAMPHQVAPERPTNAAPPASDN